ncbi:MAG TPA: DUF5681 domain-containing protein [Rhizomicrobium sp.]|jgi:hypothetical protein
MREPTGSYSVGRGRPPLHTRFQKGQSGNPSGKPGPAKLAKERFQRALLAALEGSPQELEHSKPDSVVAAIARKMALDASGGRILATRLVLSLLDTESKASAPEEEEPRFTVTEFLSLLENEDTQCLEDILWPRTARKPLQTDTKTGKEPIRDSAPPSSACGRNEAEPFSLVQGKKQGSENTSTEQIWPVQETARMPIVSRAQLMTGAAAVPI